MARERRATRALAEATFTLLCGIAIGVMVTSTLPSVANAQVCPSVRNNITTREADHVHRGTRVLSKGEATQPSPPGMWVPNAGVVCARVSSIVVFYNGGNQAEMGWWQKGNESGRCGIPWGDERPYTLAVKLRSGRHKCDNKTPLALTSGNYHTFAVKDHNADHSFVFIHNTNTVWTSTLKFTYGWSVTNGERHSLQDFAYSEFKGLQKDTRTGWRDWTTPTKKFCDDDLAYDAIIDSDTHSRVVRTDSQTRIFC